MILDTSILIATERRREHVDELIFSIRSLFGPVDLRIATVSAVELYHGLGRAKDESQRQRRAIFLEDAFRSLGVIALTLEIAELAGRVEGEQAALGIGIPFEDLLIGTTALHLGFDVLTLNEKHFKLIPGLVVHSF